MLCSRLLCPSCLKQLPLTPTHLVRTLPWLTLKRQTSQMTSLVFFSFYIFLYGKRTGIVFLIFFLFTFFLYLRFLTWRANHLEGSSLTTSLRYQALLSCFLFFFCNQLAFARLVIRRAVEMESLQFVGCSWFIGLIGLVSDSPRINLPKLNMCAIPPLPCLF